MCARECVSVGIRDTYAGYDKFGKLLMLVLAKMMPPWMVWFIDESQTGGVCDEADGAMISPFLDTFWQIRLVHV